MRGMGVLIVSKYHCFITCLNVGYMDLRRPEVVIDCREITCSNVGCLDVIDTIETARGDI